MKSVSVMKLQLIREKDFIYGKVCDKESAEAILRAFGLADAPEEMFMMLCMATNGELIGLHQVAIGSLNQAIVSPREVFKRALLNNAAAIIVAHNHPSGDPTPSQSDIDTTKKLINAGELLNIRVQDHIILGHKTYYSFRKSEQSIFF